MNCTVARQHVDWQAEAKDRIVIEGMWIVECRDCGEFRVSWDRGYNWFPINHQNHFCQKNQWWDHAPVTWFSASLEDGYVQSRMRINKFNWNRQKRPRKWP